MANRHLSRSIVLQALFELDFNDQIQNDKKVLEILNRDTKEFGPGLDDSFFMESLINGIIKKRKSIDAIIEKAAPEWPIDKISGIDRNVLRLGLYELLFGDRNQVPPKVAINESIELAKSFGGENSSKFVNGVLGTVYREIGEPGKDQTSKKKTKETIDLSKLPVQKLGGAVVYTKKDNSFRLALVHDVFGYWTLSKGKLEEGENEKDGTVREIKEEIGLDIKIKSKLGDNEYIASHPEQGKIKKHVFYFLAESSFKELKLESTGGLDDAKWFKLGEIPNLKIYDDILPIITRAIEKITK